MALKRRDFLKSSAAFAAASAAGGFSCIELASAAPIQPPVVDRLGVRVLVDGAYNLFLRPGEVKGVKVEPAPRTDYRRALHNQWGLSLLLEFAARERAAHGNARLRLHAGSRSQQLRAGRRRPQEDRGTDRQSRAFRPLRRLDRIPRQVSRRASGRPHALCRRRGQFLPPLQRRAGPAHRFRRARSARAGEAQGQGRLAESPDRGGPRLHDRHDQAQQHREGIAQYPRRVRYEGRARLQCEPLPAGRDGRARSYRTSTFTSTPPAST